MLDLFGMVVAEIDRLSAVRSGMETRDGLIVRAVTWGGPADRAGVAAGDLLCEADGTRVRRIRDLQECILLHQDNEQVGLLFRRVGSLRYLALPLEGNARECGYDDDVLTAEARH